MLTSKGLWSLIASYSSLVLSATLFIYPPLLLASLMLTISITLYMILTHRKLKNLGESATPVEREVYPNAAAIGQPINVELKIRNHSGKSILVSVVDSHEGLELIAGSASAEGFLEPGGVFRITYRVRSALRGEYEIGPAEIKILDFNGLWARRYLTGPSNRVLVALPTGLWARAGDTNLRSYGGAGGSGINPLTGADEVFKGVRKYEEGDPVKRVAWKRTARDGDHEIYLKQYDHYSSINITFLVDCSYSMAFGSPMLLDSCLTAVTSLARTFLVKGDRVVLTTFGGERDFTIRAGSFAADYPLILKILSQVRPGSNYDLSKLVEKAGPSHLTFVLSRFAYTTGPELASFDEKLRTRGLRSVLICPTLDKGVAKSEVLKLLDKLERTRIEALKSKTPSLMVLSVQSLVPNMLNLYQAYGWRYRTVESR